MSNLFSDFKKVSKEKWQDQIVADLKGKSLDLLHFHDEIENLSFDAFYHSEDVKTSNDVPGNFPFQRGFNKASNSWLNTGRITFEDESFANQHALKLLMSGADSIWFDPIKPQMDWNKVLDEILLEYITCQFTIRSIEEFRTIKHVCKDLGASTIRMNYDAMELYTNGELVELSTFLRSEQHQSILINGFGLQQTGASCSEEIAFCLSMGHQVISDLLDHGLSIDEAAACIHFHVGIGSNYFLEITKLKVLRELWSKVIDEYKPEHDCTYHMTITAVTGHCNKSLTDPYTNLLRQTTETMSALSGGVDHICVLPYDLYSTNGTSELAARMAMNIPLILKEESYLDKVIDPTAGSYNLDHLYEALGRKAWFHFGELESKGGILTDQAMEKLTSQIRTTRQKRITLFQEKKITGIGINKFPNPEAKEDSWKTLQGYLNIEPLVLEVEYNTVNHAG